MSEVANPLEPVAGDPSKKPKGDLGVRVLSAILMIVVAGSALWLGGWIFVGFVLLIAVGIMWEMWGLIRRTGSAAWLKAIGMMLGVCYVGVASIMLIHLRSGEPHGMEIAALPVLLVATIDISAYFSGRALGGPKIAPKISPSKTWAGLLGAIVGAIAFLTLASRRDYVPLTEQIVFIAALGAVSAVVAQAGDFFESWLKRRAGVKDSGKLIPGHGGLFDRTDGLVALLFVAGIWVAMDELAVVL